MNDSQYREILEEVARRKQAENNIPNVLKHAFPKQISFIKHPCKKKTLFCTRRSAKSYTAGLYLVDEALHHPGANCLFVGLTRESAKGIIWKDILQKINIKYALGASFNKSDLSMTFPNGSVISVTGIDVDELEMNKLLGRKFRLACIDEGSMYTIDLYNFVYGILDPAMTDPDEADGESGTICLMGTASDFPRGLFYDITTGKEGGWELFQWSAHDNPYVAKKWAEKLEEIRENRPEYMETPQYKQWYLNLWFVDSEKICYKFNPLINLAKSLPHLKSDGWTFVLGIDTGWEDESALALTGYHINDPLLYGLRSFKKKGMDFDELGDKIREFARHDEWAPHKYFIDGANKQGVESMRHRTGIPFEIADKRDKATFIEMCSNDMSAGRIKVLDTAENRPLWEEWMGLIWLTEGGKIKQPKKENPSLPNHLCDAFLYAWRCGYHYLSSPAEKTVIRGSREWYEQQSRDIWDRERKFLENQTDNNAWPDEGSLGELG